MNRLKNHKLVLPFSVLLLFLLNVLQGSLSELLPDEAYYWVYSQYLDWGFFDHPPLVAVWIWISHLFFGDEVGVRFFSAVSFSILIFLVWGTIHHPIKRQYTGLFILIAFSTMLLNAYGFITTPDTPLLVFFSLFLFTYKRYLIKKDILNYFLFTLAITGMMYSKYQGVLIILFVLLSNWKLVKDTKLWWVVLGSLVLYTPHLYWQNANDFPSFRYHLYERASIASYRLEYTLMHFLNAIAILGFTSIIMYKAFFKGIKNKDPFQKGLNFIVVGFFLFFLIASFRGHVQAQWIAPIMIPLILISFDYLIKYKKDIPIFTYLAVMNIGILLFARIIIANEAISPFRLEFHGNKQWTSNVKEQTKNSDKLFINSFQNASVYWFYTREKSHYQKNYSGRKNQFDFIPNNRVFNSDSIAYLTRVPKKYTKVRMKCSGNDSIFLSYIPNYRPLFELEMNFVDPDQIKFNTTSVNSCSVLLKNPYDSYIALNTLVIELVFQNKKGDKIYSIPTESNKKKIKPHSQEVILLEFDGKKIDKSGEYATLGIGMKTSEKMDLVKVSSLYEFDLVD